MVRDIYVKRVLMTSLACLLYDPTLNVLNTDKRLSSQTCNTGRPVKYRPADSGWKGAKKKGEKYSSSFFRLLFLLSNTA